MHHYVFPLIFIAVVYLGMIFMNERYRLFSADRFSSPAIKVIAYVWLGILMFLLAILVTGSSLRIPTAQQLARVPFYSLFGLHAILFVFISYAVFFLKKKQRTERRNIPL